LGEGWRVKGGGVRTVEIAYNPGVMDPVEGALEKLSGDMGIYGVKSLRTEKNIL